MQFDPKAGTGQFVMTAHGLRPKADVDAALKAEADRLRKQEPLERQYA